MSDTAAAKEQTGTARRGIRTGKNGKRAAAWALCALIMALGFGMRALSFFLLPMDGNQREIYRNESGEPYLTDPDSYYYLRMAEQMAETGKPFLLIRRAEDPLRTPRTGGEDGTQAEPMLLPLITYGIWKALSPFFSLSVAQVAGWMGPVFGSLAALPVFLYLKLRRGLTGAAVGALMIVAAVPMVSGTAAGVFDTDALLGLLPLAMMLLFLRSLQEKDWRRQLAFSTLSAFCFGLISVLWIGYYAWFWMMVISGLLCVVAAAVFREKTGGAAPAVLRGWMMTAALSLAMLLLLRGREGLQTVLRAAEGVKVASQESGGLPSAFRFTGEMQPQPFFPVDGPGISSLLGANQDSVLGRMGGLLPLAAALSAIPLGLWAARPDGKKPEEKAGSGERMKLLTEAGVLLPWLAAGLMLAVSARRFAKIAVLPLAVLTGLAAGSIRDLFLPRDRRLKPLLCGFLAALLAGPSGVYAARLSVDNVPGATDSMARAMAEIREVTAADAVIAAWWDDGYYAEEAAGRRSLADGGMTDDANRFFLAKALLTENPAQAERLLRMLEYSGTRAFSRLGEWGYSDAAAAELLLSLAALKDSELPAALSAEQKLSGERGEELRSLLRPEETPPILLCLHSGLLSRWGAIAYYGLWDPGRGGMTSSPILLTSEASGRIGPEESCSLRMRESGLLTLKRDGEGMLRPEEASDPLFLRYGALSVWRNGEEVLQEEGNGEGPALFLLEEDGQISALACGMEVRDSVLVRLLVCGAHEYGSFRLRGEWTDGAENVESPVQCRLQAQSESPLYTGIWQISGGENASVK